MRPGSAWSLGCSRGWRERSRRWPFRRRRSRYCARDALNARSPQEAEGLAAGVSGGSDPVWGVTVGGAGGSLTRENHISFGYLENNLWNSPNTSRSRTHHLVSPVTKPQGPCPRGCHRRSHHTDVLDSRPRVMGAPSGRGDPPSDARLVPRAHACPSTPSPSVCSGLEFRKSSGPSLP